jgi:hypothetical protein
MGGGIPRLTDLRRGTERPINGLDTVSYLTGASVLADGRFDRGDRRAVGIEEPGGPVVVHALPGLGAAPSWACTCTLG